jgi:hypothetical protein
MKLTGKRLLLLLLYAPIDTDLFNAPITGRTRLMKMVFLFEKEVLSRFREDPEVDEADLPVFKPWRYGPFSAQVLNDLEFLVNRGFICLERGENASSEELDEITYWLDEYGETIVGEFNQESFTLCDSKGSMRAKSLWGEISASQRALLSEFKRRFSRVSLDRILDYVYNTYTDYTDESLIKDRYV